MANRKKCALWLVLALTMTIQQTNGNFMPEGRIISGIQAAPGQFPWQVILKKDADDDLLCGASIISDLWVLTAAHCTYGKDSVLMVFGTTNLNDDTAQTMTSQSIYVHSDYNDSNLNNDVSLILLPRPLVFSSSVQPIPLVPASTDSGAFIGSTATITGYGYMDDDYLDFSKVLMYAQVTIIDNKQCADIFGSKVVTDTTLCAKGYNNTNMSICSGDSGGPLVVMDSSGNYMQIGINSFVAQDMCTEGYPSGYVRLSAYVPYVSQVTGLNFN